MRIGIRKRPFLARFHRTALLSLVALLGLILGQGPASGQAITVHYARGFQVENFGACHLVTLHPTWKGDPATYRYLLVPRGEAVPPAHPPAQVVRVPVQRVVALSTTHLAYMAAAGQVDRLVGLDGFAFVNTPAVRRRIDAGGLTAVGHGTRLRIENLLELAPDLILTPASGSVHDVHPKLLEAGLTTGLVLEHMEAHPLGRCEWMKFLALFFGTGEHAESLFKETAARYTDLVHKVAQASRRPKVITGAPFQGRWYVPRGESFMARLLADAGGAYAWAATPGVGSVAMDVEAVYGKALEADLWLNTGTWRSVADATAADPRFGAVPALVEGRVFNNDKRLNASGGNDYWESGLMRPDVVLADLITILHPDLLPGRELVYYRPLDRGGHGRGSGGGS
jgi:iron complex transport system substrate-binding protein